jgi:hypothetical protein
MTEEKVYQPKSILQSYRESVNEVLKTINPDYEIAKNDLSIKDMNFSTRNHFIKDTFHKGYNYAREIITSGTNTEKSELERTLNNILDNVGKENITVPAYGNPDIIEYDTFRNNLYNAYFGGAYTAYKKPQLSEKEQHEELVKMIP